MCPMDAAQHIYRWQCHITVSNNWTPLPELENPRFWPQTVWDERSSDSSCGVMRVFSPEAVWIFSTSNCCEHTQGRLSNTTANTAAMFPLKTATNKCTRGRNPKDSGKKKFKKETPGLTRLLLWTERISVLNNLSQHVNLTSVDFG